MRFKDWWYGADSPSYKWYKLTRWVHAKLSGMGLITGHCVGCRKDTKGYDSYYEWHICPNCISDEVAYSIAEHVMYPNGRENQNY